MSSRLKLLCAASVLIASVSSSMSLWAEPAPPGKERDMKTQLGHVEWAAEHGNPHAKNIENISRLLKQYDFKFSEGDIVHYFDRFTRDGVFEKNMDFLDLFLQQKFSAQKMSEFLESAPTRARLNIYE